MPTYTYRCKTCNEKFEINQRITDDSFEKHSEAHTNSKCNGKLNKIMHAPLIKFLGTGFYETDYKNKEKKAPSNSSKEPSKPIKKLKEVIKT